MFYLAYALSLEIFGAAFKISAGYRFARRSDFDSPMKKICREAWQPT